MEIKKQIKNSLFMCCVYFTAIMVCYMAILQFMNMDSVPAAVEAYRVLLFFLASFLFAIANFVRHINMNSALKILCHYLICVFAFFACFLLQGSYIVIGIVVFTILYFIVRLLIMLFSSRLKKNREQTEEYTKQFSKKKR